MHPTQPDQGEFARLLASIQDRAGLSYQQVADAAGVNRSQAWRWVNSGSAPGYEHVRRLAAHLVAAHPQLADDAAALLPAAGYQTPPVTAEAAASEPVPEPAPEPAAGNAEDIGDAVVTVLRARQGEPGVWADLRDHLASVGLFADSTEVRAWPPGEIPAKLTPRAKDALDAAARAGALFRDAVGDSAARLPYDWHLRVRMITQLRETARETVRNPTRARRAG